MKLIELRAACVGKNSVQIDTLIKNTDEYQATQRGDGVRFARDTYTAGILLARGDQFEHGKPTATANAMWQAAEQGMAADGATSIADRGIVCCNPARTIHSSSSSMAENSNLTPRRRR
jgi:hypothetical protein